MGNIEPNTGTMMIRATEQGLKLMDKFLLRLVNVNKANDQPYFNSELGNVRITSDHPSDLVRYFHQKSSRTSTDSQK